MLSAHCGQINDRSRDRTGQARHPVHPGCRIE
jgi:hypothetical protein